MLLYSMGSGRFRSTASGVASSTEQIYIPDTFIEDQQMICLSFANQLLSKLPKFTVIWFTSSVKFKVFETEITHYGYVLEYPGGNDKEELGIMYFFHSTNSYRYFIEMKQNFYPYVRFDNSIHKLGNKLPRVRK